jgi:hypothetical protein
VGRGLTHPAEDFDHLDPSTSTSTRQPPAVKGHPVKYILPLLAVALGLALGVAGIVYGEADDSPGLQLLGVLFVLTAVVFGVRTVRGRG